MYSSSLFNGAARSQVIRGAVHNKDGSFVRGEIRRLDVTLVFAVTLDVSGSMSGSKLATAIRKLGFIYNDVMRKEDRFALAVFSSDVQTLHGPMTKKRVDWRRDVGNIHRASGGGTALYDAIASSLDSIKSFDFPNKGENHSYVVEHLVITDGEDNSSSKSLSNVADMLKHPGIPDYNLTVISIGVDHAAKNNLKRLTRPRHCHYRSADNVRDFAQVMEQVIKRVRMMIEAGRDGQVHDRRIFEGSARDAARALPALTRGIAGIEGLMRRLALDN